MNLVDLLIAMLFIGVAAAGFFAGIARMLSVMVGMYFATVLAATFYERAGDIIQDALNQISTGAAEFTAFILLFLVLTVGFAYIIFRTTHPVSPRRRFAIFDSIGGATLSVVVAFVSITMALAITVVMIQAARSTAVGSDVGLMENVDNQIEASSLAPIFMELLPFITLAVRPWFPGGLPPILTEVSV